MTSTTPISIIAPDQLEDFLADLPPSQSAWARSQKFEAAAGKFLCLPDDQGNLARVLVGQGAEARRARHRFVLAGFAAAAPEGRYRLETALDADTATREALGWQLAQYRFTRFKGTPREMRVLETPQGVDQAEIDAMIGGSTLARDLINTPANEMGPDALEAAVRDLAAQHGAEVTVIAGDDLLAQNFPLIHAVGRAAAQAPRLIEMRWGTGPEVALVGKGVCFDTGGLNLKPGASMALMKKDMGGAACILGLASMIMESGMKVALRVLIPAVENSVSGPSMRPGDVVMSRKGLSVEINNTDAEGRLVLADALALACEGSPEIVLDMATLTGAARVALGPDLPPVYSDDDDLASEIAAGGTAMADPVWRMPLWPVYEEMIEPEIADLDNAPAGAFAGSITAALFLKRFVNTTAWAHFDIYGWAPKAQPGRPKGGECQASRAAFAMLRKRYG
ncbi:leucyl aminopeptidase family protein [Rhodobacteraceae bacterium NNCM2]|nr:leucyl aminopeptidase family protein [Coraliihabitans acroporae]